MELCCKHPEMRAVERGSHRGVVWAKQVLATLKVSRRNDFNGKVSASAFHFQGLEEGEWKLESYVEIREMGMDLRWLASVHYGT